jgi:hypothetical protein
VFFIFQVQISIFKRAPISSFIPILLRVLKLAHKITKNNTILNIIESSTSDVIKLSLTLKTLN